MGNGPGAIALNLRPYLAHSVARDLVIVSTPDLEIAEGTTNGAPALMREGIRERRGEGGGDTVHME